MATSKEQCFEEALDKYQDATGKDLGLKHRQPWVQGQDGRWRQEERGFWAGVNSMMKTIKSRLGLGEPGSSQQVRVPDLTVGDKLVVDTKFTRSDGTVDNWGERPGAGNGRTQVEDYNDINQQQNPGNKNVKDVKLDPETCNCKGRAKATQGEPQPVTVEKWVADPTAAFLMPLYEGGLPATSGAPAARPVMPRIPAFRFVFP
jgi:hypothetical protein